MKRRIIRAAESNNTRLTAQISEAYTLLKTLEDMLADLSDEFWTLTPTQSWTRLNKTSEYLMKARAQLDKVEVPENIEESCNVKADTVKKKNGKWTNKGDTGEEHGEFDTKEEADAQRKAMYANGYKG